MLTGDNDEHLVGPCNDDAQESAQVMLCTLESDLVDMRPDLLAALNIVLRCHGYLPVTSSRFCKLPEWEPSALVDTLASNSEFPGIAHRSRLIAVQLWNVFLMRECQSSALMPQAAATIRQLESTATRILVKSAYPVAFAQAVLERFRLERCAVVSPQRSDHVDSLCYGWYAAGIRLRYPVISAHTRVGVEQAVSLQAAA